MWKGVPRSHVYRLIREGQVRVNGSRSRVHRKLVAGDLIRLPPIRVAAKQTMPVPDVLQTPEKNHTLYEDDNLLIINKPTGVAVHGGSGLRGGVIEILRASRTSEAYLELAHRLDRETSGCLILAKNPAVLRSLHNSLRNPSSNGIRKKYLALLVGDWDNGPREIDLSLQTVRVSNDSRRSVVANNGRHADSRFVPIQHFKGFVLVEVEPRTGRMHQIRAHAAAIGYPVGGDRKYGSREANRRLQRVGLKRLFLHAVELRLAHPQTGQQLTITAEIPDDLREVLAGLS
jgi:23S rRNA pseudouridine955/2504/2580 synthase